MRLLMSLKLLRLITVSLLQIKIIQNLLTIKTLKVLIVKLQSINKRKGYRNIY